MKKKCPCCEYRTLVKRGEYFICPICFWEDDGLENLDIISGPNHITLREAKENFKSFGASDKNAIKFVRNPKEEEKI